MATVRKRARSRKAAPPSPAELERVLRLQLPVSVRLVRKQMPVSEILKLDRGSVLEFDKPVEAPLELMVNQKVLGVGEAVQLGNGLGLRITRIDGPRAKLDALSTCSLRCRPSCGT